jgi:DNA-binding MarR family transcriptional regulator
VPTGTVDSGTVELDQVLRTITRHLRGAAFATKVGEKAKVQLEPSLYTLLTRIGDSQPVRAAVLADSLGVTPSTISRQVTQLESRGLVKRAADPADGRALILRLTPQGAKVRQRLQDAWASILSNMVGDWGKKDVDALVGALGRFETALGSFVKS